MKLFNSHIATCFTQSFVLVTLTLLSLNLALGNNVEEFLSCLPLHSNASTPIQKAIYTPKDASFPTILQAYIRNLRFNMSTTPKPLVIITALDKSHVQATVVCARAAGLEIRIRSGGHDYEGLSYVSSNPFVILDLFNLRFIDIDLKTETCWIDSGAILGELYYNIANKSNTLAFPAGVCTTVGVGGHFTGGGYGTMLRKFGLTVDHVIDAEIVDSNGRILDRKMMGEDLFWAIRGGGAASFGVVLRWKIQLVRVPNIVTTFQLQKTLDGNLTDVFYQWQNFAPITTPDLFLRVQANIGHDIQKNKILQLSFIALYLGNAKDLVQLMDKEFPQLGLHINNCTEQRWIESHLLFNNLPMNTSLDIYLNRVPHMSLTYDKHKSDYVEKAIPKAGLDALWKKLIELENVTMQFNPYGGKMGEISEDATPFPHRKGKLFKIQYLAYWHDGSPEVIDRNVKATREVYEFMTPFVSKNPREAFLNYRDIDIGTNVRNSTDFALDFFKGNLKRLLMVKAKVDPTNFFRHEQSIPVSSYYNYLSGTQVAADVSSGGSISSTSDEKSRSSRKEAGYASGGRIRQSATPEGRQGHGWSTFSSGNGSRGGSARQSTASSRGSNASVFSHDAQFGQKSGQLCSGVNDVKKDSSNTVKGSSNGSSDCSTVNLDSLFMESLIQSPGVAQASPDPVPVKSCSEAKTQECSDSSLENKNTEYHVQKFDICRPQNSDVFTLKPALFSKNREKRKEKERSINGSERLILGSGMVLLKNYLSISEQASIIEICRQHGKETGFYLPYFGENGKMHLKLMCFGAFWNPETNEYTEVRPMDHAKPPPIPHKFQELVARSIKDSQSLISEKPKIKDVESILPSVQPDICLVNFYYPNTGRLGLHQDNDESLRSLDNGIPIVSFSIGDSAEFLYSDHYDEKNAKTVTLESGDVLIFGGKSRRIFHGVTKVKQETAPKSLLDETNFRAGRLNLTFRQRF